MNNLVYADYFYGQFRNIYSRLVEESIYQIEENNDEMIDRLLKAERVGQLYFTFDLPSNKRIHFMERSLKEICKLYASLVGSKEEDEDCFFFLDKLLKSNIASSYNVSFFFFVQFFCRDYFETLGKGSFDLWSSFGEQKEYQVHVTDEGNILSCEAINMSLLEETNTLLQLLMMEKEQKQGPILGVRFVKDN